MNVCVLPFHYSKFICNVFLKFLRSRSMKCSFYLFNLHEYNSKTVEEYNSNCGMNTNRVGRRLHTA